MADMMEGEIQPKAKEVLSAIITGDTSPSDTSAKTEQQELNEEERIEQGLKYDTAKTKLAQWDGFIKMRERWSEVILKCVVAIICFDFLVIFLSGLKILDFQKDWVLPTIIGDSLIKVFGLAWIMVEFLFNEKSILSEEGKRDKTKSFSP